MPMSGTNPGNDARASRRRTARRSCPGSALISSRTGRKDASISSAMTSSTRSVSFLLVEVLRDLAQLLAVPSAPMKFTLIHGMPNFFSIISAM
jgi:hypothetical protein